MSAAVVYHGGPVLTMNAEREILPAGTGIVTEHGRIAGFTGPESEAGADLRRVDLGPGPILPAFLDPHVHLGMTNDSMAHVVDCHTPPRETIDEMVDALREGIELAGARGGWLLGQGSLMQDQKLRDGRLPNRTDLDRVSTTTPIVVRCGGHVTVLNTKALELAGLASYRELPGSADLLTDADGVPNGILLEGFGHIPIPSLAAGERRTALKATLDTLFTRNGITYLGEISHSIESLEDLAEIAGFAPLTADAFVHLPDTASGVREAVALRDRFAGTGLRIRGVKIFVDGGFSARTAASSRPYQPAGGTGELYYELEELVTLMVSAAAEGLQVIAHTNGDLAQTLVCEAAFRARRASTDVSVRLEHAGNWVPDFEIVDHWMDAGVTMVSQPGFIYTMGPYFPDLFGSAGRRGLFPYRSLLAAGIPIGASSDVSGSELRHANPMFNVQCAVERIGFGGAVIEADESIDVLTALELQTSQAARAAGIASERGAITRGLVADLVSLSEDPRSLPPGELSRVTVRSVVRDGELALTPAARIG